MLGPIVFCSLVLLFSAHYGDYPRSLPSVKKRFALSHLSAKEKVIIGGLVLGQKPRKKKLRTAIKNLQIYHLFTPSGLHLSSFLWFLSFFSLRRVALLSLFPLILYIDSFFAFKRVFFIKFFKELLRARGCYVDTKYIFLFVFIFEFIFWAQRCLLSFSYSFLFLGIIYSLRHSSPLILVCGIWFGQSLVASFLQDSVYLLALPLNGLVTFLVTLCYPLILINALFPIGFSSYFYDLILLFGRLLEASNLKVSSIQLTIVLAMIVMRRARWPGLVLLGFISLSLY